MMRRVSAATILTLVAVLMVSAVDTSYAGKKKQNNKKKPVAAKQAKHDPSRPVEFSGKFLKLSDKAWYVFPNQPSDGTFIPNLNIPEKFIGGAVLLEGSAKDLLDKEVTVKGLMSAGNKFRASKPTKVAIVLGKGTEASKKVNALYANPKSDAAK